MRIILKNSVISAVLVFFCLPVIGILAVPKARTQRNAPKQKQSPSPYVDARVLVEAFVVEVKLTALYDLGVSPIGQKPNSVSIHNIVKCLRAKGKAKVITGAKVAARHNDAGRTETSKMIYVSWEQASGAKKSYNSYTVGKEFETRVYVTAERKIKVGYEFEQNDLKISEKKDSPPSTFNRSWSGQVSLDPGKPSIVGAEQDEENIVFLILCADVENK